MYADDAVAALLGLAIPPRTKKARLAGNSGAPTAEDVFAETWEPMPWPVHDDYPGEPWIGVDDSFAAW
jgi:hypothetical protein